MIKGLITTPHQDLCPVLKVSARGSGSTQNNLGCLPGFSLATICLLSAPCCHQPGALQSPYPLLGGYWLCLGLADRGPLSRGPTPGHRGFTAQRVPPGITAPAGYSTDDNNDIDINNSSYHLVSLSLFQAPRSQLYNIMSCNPPLPLRLFPFYR